MSQVRVNESSLTNIADAIRDKNHEVTKYKPSEMPAAISRIKTTDPVFDKLTVTENGKYTPPAEIDGYNEVDVNVQPNLTSINITANGQYTPTDTDGFNEVNVAVEGIPTDADLTISEDCGYRFANGGWDWVINKYGNRITTTNILTAYKMFNRSTVETIPFELNFSTAAHPDLSNMFESCENLTSVPKINNCAPGQCNYIFSFCWMLRNIPADIATWFDWSYMDNLTSEYSGGRNYTFYDCYSLRSVPMSFLAHGNPVANYYYANYQHLFTDCYALDEILNLPIPHYNATWTNNAFSYTFYNCYRLKNVTFALNPETNAPYVVRWKNQQISLTTAVGYSAGSFQPITSYNSGITKDKMVRDPGFSTHTYEELKNDPDWFAIDVQWSRYNHDSAVATINSLPDTSAYLATAGGTNTINFNGASGSSTDGGAINTLTEAEIAVATSKGWTVNIS